MSDELPVIMSIDDLPETAIEELTCGDEPKVVEEKPLVKAASKPKKVEEVVEPTVEETPVEEDTHVTEEVEVVKPKRKRRTKAEIEAAKAAEAVAKE